MPRRIGQDLALNVTRTKSEWALGFLLRAASGMPNMGVVATVPTMIAIQKAKGGIYRGRRYSIEQRESIDSLFRILGDRTKIETLVNATIPQLRALSHELECAARLLGITYTTGATP